MSGGGEEKSMSLKQTRAGQGRILVVKICAGNHIDFFRMEV